PRALGARRPAASGSAFWRLLPSAIPQGDLDRLNELLRERGLEPMDPTQPFVPRGVPDGAMGARIAVSSMYEEKARRTPATKTQAELDDVPFDLWPEILSTEAFVVAWPERRPRDP